MVRPKEERWGYGTGPGTNGRVLWGQPYCEPSSCLLHAAGFAQPRARRCFAQPFCTPLLLRSPLPDGLAHLRADDLIDNPKLVPILEELFSDPELHHALPGTPAKYSKLFHMDHDNSHFTSPFDPENKAGFEGKQGGAETFNQTETWTPDGLVRGGLHGGGSQLGNMITVIYELTPIEEGAGGTACISGSHRDDFANPDIKGRNLPPWPEEFGVELATVQPGDCLVFTENMWAALLLPPLLTNQAADGFALGQAARHVPLHRLWPAPHAVLYAPPSPALFSSAHL